MSGTTNNHPTLPRYGTDLVPLRSTFGYRIGTVYAGRGALHRSAFQHLLSTLGTGSPETLTATETCTLDPADPIVVLITTPSAAEARMLADLLVEENLAACVQILPSLESVYRWKGNVERISEVLLMAKTLGGRFQELEERVRAEHSYETPEIVAIPVTAISSPYLEWLAQSLDSQPD